MKQQTYTHQNPPSKALFQPIYDLLVSSFPPNEYRPFAMQYSLFQKEEYILMTFEEKKEVLALVGMWKLAPFLFIEHLAVSSHLRGQGIGSKILQKYVMTSPKTIVLEVELPKTDIARRRIEFYKRLGFYLNSYSYAQPPYRKSESYLPMNIMSYPKELSPNEFLEMKSALYQNVYAQKK